MELSSVTVDQLTYFLGWCVLINLAFLVVTALAILCFRSAVIRFYSKLLKVDGDEVTRIFYRYLVQYEVAVMVLNIVPYIVLKIIA